LLGGAIMIPWSVLSDKVLQCAGFGRAGTGSFL